MPSNPTRYKSISVPEWAYEELKTLQQRLLAGGTASLPEYMREFADEKNRPDEGAPIRKEAWTLGTVFGIAAKMAHRTLDALVVVVSEEPKTEPKKRAKR